MNCIIHRNIDTMQSKWRHVAEKEHTVKANLCRFFVVYICIMIEDPVAKLWGLSY